MAMKQISKSGYDKLKEELDYPVGVKRAEMAQKLKEARAQGDLSENAEYDEAKNEQAILEAQIKEIQYTLDNCEVVDDDSISLDEVGLGSTIKLKNFQSGKVETWQIVSSNEANFAEHKIFRFRTTLRLEKLPSRRKSAKHFRYLHQLAHCSLRCWKSASKLSVI